MDQALRIAARYLASEPAAVKILVANYSKVQIRTLEVALKEIRTNGAITVHYVTPLEPQPCEDDVYMMVACRHWDGRAGLVSQEFAQILRNGSGKLPQPPWVDNNLRLYCGEFDCSHLHKEVTCLSCRRSRKFRETPKFEQTQ
jgi:hypothetical protein